MPLINFEKKVLFDLLNKELSDEELSKVINSMGVALDELTDDEIIVEVFPNRPDLLSLRGFVRALKFFLELDKPSLNLENGLEKPEHNYKVIIDESVKEVRPFTACAIVKDLSLNDEKIKEIIQIQEKLHITFGRNRKKVAIGIYPLEKIKLPIRYLAKKPKDIKFIPLGETREMDGLQILKEHPKGKEFAHLLEGKDVFPVFMDSNDNILSMPPIINSELTGRITEETKEVFIECSGFDFKDVLNGINIITIALKEMGGKVYQMILEYPDKTRVTPDYSFDSLNLDKAYVKKYLGLGFSDSEIERSLNKMGLVYIKDKSQVKIPPYRVDIIHPIDIVEDIAIGYGYNNFPSEFSPVFSVGEESKKEVFFRKVRESLIAHGLIEVKNYCLSNPEDETKNILKNWEIVKLKNSWNRDFSVLRRSLLSSILNTFKRNKHYEYPQNIFEIGTIFIPETDKIKEEDHLLVALASNDVSYTDIRQILDAIARDFDVSLSYNEYKDEWFIEGRGAVVYLKQPVVKALEKEPLAYIGELNPKIIENFDLQIPIAFFELNLDLLFKEVFAKNK